MTERQVHLSLPVTPADVRQLSVGDEVYLTGRVYVMRLASLARALREHEAGRPLPFDLEGGAVYNTHIGIHQEEGGWKVRFLGPILSYRAARDMAVVIGSLGVRLVIGKAGAGVNSAAVAAMREHGAALLGAIGGCPNFYRDYVAEEVAVYWEDLGLEKVVALDLERYGPLFVTVDAHGKEIYRPGSYVVQGL